MLRISPLLAASLALAGAAVALPDQHFSEPVRLVATGIGQCAEVSPTVPGEDRRPVLAMAWHRLEELVTRWPDGSALALHRYEGFRTWVEWRNLRIVAMNAVDADGPGSPDSGGRRYLCLVRADAHRVWRPEVPGWSRWIAGDFMPFPRIIEVTRTAEGWRADTLHAGEFLPPSGIDRRGGVCEREGTAGMRDDGASVRAGG